MEHQISAKGKTIGRLASEVAILLQGKNSANYEPRLEGEDKVIIKDISELGATGKKMAQKKYYRHTTQIGHLKEETLQMVWDKKGPAEVLRRAVKGMLPRNKLAARRMKRLIIEK